MSVLQISGVVFQLVLDLKKKSKPKLTILSVHTICTFHFISLGNWACSLHIDAVRNPFCSTTRSTTCGDKVVDFFTFNSEFWWGVGKKGK